MYWLYLFRDHYFRLETSAYGLQVDLMTALSQLHDSLASWTKYLATAVYWNVEFSFLRQRFFLRHGPLWFAITDEGCTQFNDSAERIEYHDAFPDEYMARLRRLYGASEIPDHDDFEQRLGRRRPSGIDARQGRALDPPLPVPGRECRPPLRSSPSRPAL